MPKVPTIWTNNTGKNVNVPQYSSSSLQYSNASTAYSSPTVTLNEAGKNPTIWANQTKNATIWTANKYTYYQYDSAFLTYDAYPSYDLAISATTSTKWTTV